MRQLLIILTLCGCFVVANAQIKYVTPNGTGNGNSWANASGNLRNILQNATPGTQVWVAMGTYYPTTCAPCNENEKSISFIIPDGVAVYGGFVGNETQLEARDWQNNITILSGDIDQNNTTNGNSYNIIYTHNVTNSLILDGFTIQGGNANHVTANLGNLKNSGGAWYNDGAVSGSYSSPTIRNCFFTNNKAKGYGGALYNYGGFSGQSSPTIINCRFENNIGQFGGGAICNNGEFAGQANAQITNCQFVSNEALDSVNGSGGAIYNLSPDGGFGSPSFTNCIFINNTASKHGGVLYNFAKSGFAEAVFTGCTFQGNNAFDGGALYTDVTYEGHGIMTLDNCIFENNTSINDGGAMCSITFGGGNANHIINNCTFGNNHSGGAGGAIFNSGVEGECSPKITNTKFKGNIADSYGGAIYNLGKTGFCNLTIINCLFEFNTASAAGAIYNLGSNQGNSNGDIVNCTFYKNTATDKCGAVYCNAGDGGTGISAPNIKNCIFSGNYAPFAPVFRMIYGSPVFSNCLIDIDNCDAINAEGTAGNATCTGGMIFNLNPMFVNPDGDDFHLQNASPAIDAGNNTIINTLNITVDLDNTPRINNNIVDLGAYEYAEEIILPNITAQPQSQTVCQGTDVILQVSATGTPPLSYKWYFNGSLISGENSPILLLGSAMPAQSGNYKCKVSNDNGSLVFSDIAAVIINPTLVPSISINSSDDNICEGTNIVFSTIAQNQGNNPIYTWYVNNQITGTNSSAFESNSLQNGAIISCILTSSENCVDNSIVNSNTIPIQVNPNLTPSILIMADSLEVCEGNSVIFNSQNTNSGNSPTYQWFVNGVPFGNNTPDFQTDALFNDINVECQMTSSENCLTNATVTSQTINVDVQICIANDDLSDEANIQILPNPSNGDCILKSSSLTDDANLSIYDSKATLLKTISLPKNTSNMPLELGYLPKGVYWIQIYNDDIFLTKKIMILK